MPYDWVESEILMTCNGITVYHTYKNDFIQEGRRQYIYTTDPSGEESGPFSFDVRALPDYAPGISHQEIIRRAIDNGRVVAPT